MRRSGRRLQYGYTQDPRNNAGRAAHSSRRRNKHRILKLMTQEQVDNVFPIEKFKTARERSPLNHLHHPAVEVDDDDDAKKNNGTETKKAKQPDSQETPTKRSLNLMRPFANKRDSSQNVNAEAAPTEVFEMASDLEAQTISSKSSKNLEEISLHEFPDEEQIDKDSPLDVCAICICTLDDNDEVRLLTCGHIFHSECIDPWLLRRQACCPMCKESYYKPKPEDPLGPEPIEVIEAQYLASLREQAAAGNGRRQNGRSLGAVVGRWFGQGSVANGAPEASPTTAPAAAPTAPPAGTSEEMRELSSSRNENSPEPETATGTTTPTAPSQSSAAPSSPTISPSTDIATLPSQPSPRPPSPVSTVPRS